MMFTLHQADHEQRRNIGTVRVYARELAFSLLTLCPPCADRTAALRKVREAVMTANAAIMLEGK